MVEGPIRIRFLGGKVPKEVGGRARVGDATLCSGEAMTSGVSPALSCTEAGLGSFSLSPKGSREGVCYHSGSLGYLQEHRVAFGCGQSL